MSAALYALVTGAASGIGQCTAAALEARGYTVAKIDLPGRDVSGYYAPLDVADAAAVEHAIKKAEADLGPVDALVNCAGYDVEQAFLEISPEDLTRMLRVHLGGALNTCRILGPQMCARRRGAIVNVSSELALSGSSVHPHYAAAKGAIVGFTKALALELAPYVRVNTLAPGPTDTPLLGDYYRSEEYLVTLPTRRLSTPEAIGEANAFLASDAANYFTAQVVSPNSGTVI